MKTSVLISAFVLAIVFANLSVALFGVDALPITAFLLIPFDLVVRDALHDRWSGRGLALKMGLLILAGGIASSVFMLDAARVALGSMVSFILASTIDFCVYSMRRFSKRVRMAASNAAGAITDSVVFPAVALGVVDVGVSLAQSSIKFSGSVVWMLLLSPILFAHRNQSTKHTTP